MQTENRSHHYNRKIKDDEGLFQLTYQTVVLMIDKPRRRRAGPGLGFKVQGLNERQEGVKYKVHFLSWLTLPPLAGGPMLCDNGSCQLNQLLPVR